MTKLIDSGFTSFRMRALVALVLVSGFLFFAIYKNEAARSGGAEIVLETRPIDPRDIFFGHYAILAYDIDRRDPGQSYALLDDAFKTQAVQALETIAEGQFYNHKPEPSSAYIVLRKDGDFDVADFATLDLSKAQSSGAAFLKANWSVSRHHKKCEEDQTPGDNCDWLVSISLDLPRRYYADKEAALALQSLQRDGQRFLREQRRFEDCERQRASNIETEAAPAGCEDVTGPPTEAEKVGVILSASDAGEVVIKGILVGEQKILDTLTGSRLTKKQLE